MDLGAQGWAAVSSPGRAISATEMHGAGKGIGIKGKPEAPAQDPGAEGLEGQDRVLIHCIRCNLCFPPVVVVGPSY